MHGTPNAVPHTLSLSHCCGCLDRILGYRDDNSPHVLLLGPSMETIGQHVVEVPSLELAMDTLGPNVLVGSLSSPLEVPNGTALVDDTTYSVELSYQDKHGNPVATANYLRVTKLTTRPACLELPLTESFINRDGEFTLKYLLSEQALNGSLKLVVSRTGGEADVNSPHTLVITDPDLHLPGVQTRQV